MKRGYRLVPLAVAAALSAPPADAQTIATIANGLDRPLSLAIDGSGHTIVATASNDLVEITKTGDGAAIATLGSSLGIPDAVAVNGSGDMFVIDGKRNAVVEYLASDGFRTPITLASLPLHAPTALAIDRDGNLFVNDFRPDSQSVVEELFAPDYTTARQVGGRFIDPAVLAVDNSGNLFVGDGVALAVYVIPAAGGYAANQLLASGFKSISGLAVDGQENLFVADGLARSVEELPASTGYATVKTLGGGFVAPGDIAVDVDADVFVSDVGGVLKELPAADGYATVTTLPTSFGTIGRFAVDSAGDITLPDSKNCAVDVLSAASGYASGDTVIKCLAVFNPTALAFDRAGDLFVADNGDASIKKLSAVNGFLEAERLPQTIEGLVGVAVDARDNVFYADSFGHVGEIMAIGGYADVRSVASGLNELQRIAVDDADNVFVTDVETGAVEEILAVNGAIKTIGVPLEAPQGIALDSAGNLYVAEFEGNTVIKLPAAGGFTRAEPLGAGFFLSDLAVDDAGDVYVVNAGGAGSVEEILASPLPSLFASVLPNARSVPTGEPATVFATMVNAGVADLDSCQVSLPAELRDDVAAATLSLSYQTTDATTNAPLGTPDTPVTLPADGTQTFVLALASATPFVQSGLQLNFMCQGDGMRVVAPILIGVDTVDLSVEPAATADVIALSATPSDNGVVDVPRGGTAAFAVASVNVGAGEQLTVSADTNFAALPLTATLCQTDPQTAQCLAPPTPSVSIPYPADAAPTFSVFLRSTGPIPFDPAGSRVFVRFTDASNGMRGSTSVAVETP